MPDGKIEGPGRKLSVVALTEAANSERGKVANFIIMVGDNLIKLAEDFDGIASTAMFLANISLCKVGVFPCLGPKLPGQF